MTKITLKNDTGKNVKITEGNAGSTRKLCTLEPGRTFDITNDKNATYREYFFITLPDNNTLRVLTSDDFDEYKEISIFEEGGKVDWTGTAQRPDPAQGGIIKRFLHKLGLM
jgi:hypothetical protein